MKALINATRIAEIVEAMSDKVETACGWTNRKVVIEEKYGYPHLMVSCSDDAGHHYNLTVNLTTGREVNGRIAALFLTDLVSELMTLV